MRVLCCRGCLHATVLGTRRTLPHETLCRCIRDVVGAGRSCSCGRHGAVAPAKATELNPAADVSPAFSRADRRVIIPISSFSLSSPEPHVPGFPSALERRRPRHPHPETSQGRIREAVAGKGSCLVAHCLETVSSWTSVVNRRLHSEPGSVFN